MSRRYFRNGQATSLTAPVDAVSTSIEVNSATSFPTQYPYTLIIDADGVLEEVVDVTAAVGTTLTIVRGVDGTTASPHSAGVQVYHGVSARDADEANDHIQKTTNVHGSNGALVDVASTQTITGAKDFSTITKGGVNLVDVSSAQTVNGLKTFGTRPAVTGNGDVVTTGGAQTIDGAKTFSGAEVHSGTESHSGAETHTGNETHSGTIRLSHAQMQAVEVVSTTDELNYTGTAWTPGANPVGLTFTAPPSGKGFLTLSAYFNQAIDGQVSIVSDVIRNGSTIGSGTEFRAASADRALTAGRAVNAGSPPQPQMSRRKLVTGLTPGNAYNAQVEYQTTAGGNISVFVRELLWEPHL